MRHREVDLCRADSLGPGLQLPGQANRRLGTAVDLDVLPGEGARDAEPERLPDRLLAREARRVVLGRVRPRIAVDAFGVGEAPFPEARIAFERVANSLDLDQVEADLHADSRRKVGTSTIDSTTPSGCTFAAASVSGRNLPVRTSTARIPAPFAPPMSDSMSSPTITAASGAAPSSASAASK